MAEPVALLALGIDAAIGWPSTLYRRFGHPVGAFARVINRLERSGNQPAAPDRSKRVAGVATLLILVAVSAGTSWLLQKLAITTLGSWSWIVIAIFAAPGLAQRSLHDHVTPIIRALENRDLPAARTAVGMIVGRDASALDEAGVSRAAIESLSESFCDGVAAPLFWLLLLGLPGLWAYKAINTADSLIGHREPRWRAFGWASARTDDVMNLVPSRIAAILICICGGGGWRVLWRDASNHASPNAGWPEAAMAGTLDLKLSGPIAYDGVISDKPWIGDGSLNAGISDIRRALTVYRRACGCLWIIAGVVAWAL